MPQIKDKFKAFEKLSFEDALKRLEAIVEGMEDGGIPLEEMIARFEEGSALAQLCQGRLDTLQRKIEILVKDSAQGGAKWCEFDAPSDESSSAEEDEGAEGGEESLF